MSFQGVDYDRENDVVNIASEIRLALRKMPKQYGEILLNDYFETQDYNWWKEIYSSDKYKCLKVQAIDQYLIYCQIIVYVSYKTNIRGLFKKCRT